MSRPRPVKKKPPLDRGFFRDAGKVEAALTKPVSNYMDQAHGIDIMSGDEDSLERVMAAVYPDLFNPAQEQEALEAFRAILSLFTKRLAETTSAIKPTRKRYLYRLIVSFLRDGYRPEDLTIVTFNQDLQAEKLLRSRCSAKKMANLRGPIVAVSSLLPPWHADTRRDFAQKWAQHV